MLNSDIRRLIYKFHLKEEPLGSCFIDKCLLEMFHKFR